MLPSSSTDQPRSGAALRLRRGLYAVTNGGHDSLATAAHAALAGGAAVLQYRDKSHAAARRLREARALASVCHEFAVPLIINDDVELAINCAAAGVHLGEDDVPVASARAALGPNAIIGVSCYDSLQLARDAATAGASYIAFGAFFPTQTKRVTRYASPALLRAARGLGLPLVAIGGITPDNGGPLIDAGADLLAVVSAVFGAADVRAAAQRFAALFASRKCP